MDTTTTSPQPDQLGSSPSTPNPTPSPKKKLSKKTLTFIGLLSIMLIVVGISIYVGYTQGQNEIANNQVTDNSSQNSEENTEEDNQTDDQSEGDEAETDYPIVTDLEVSTIPTPDDTLSNDYPIGEDWQEYYIEEIDTTVYQFGEEPVREFRTGTGQEEYRITFDRDLTIWITTTDSVPFEDLGKRDQVPFNSRVDSIINFNDYREETQDVEYILPVKDQDYDLVVSFDRPGLLFFEDMDLIQRYIFNIQNPGLIKYDPEIIYFVDNNPEYSIFQGGVIYNDSEEFSSSGNRNIPKNITLQPLVISPFEWTEKKVLKNNQNVYFTLREQFSRDGETILYKYDTTEEKLSKYINLPKYTLLENIDDKVINISMPCDECGEGDPLNEGEVNLEALQVTNFGSKEYQVTGYYEQEDRFAFEQNFTCDLLILQETSESFDKDIATRDFRLNRNSEGNIILNLNYSQEDNQDILDRIKGATPENPVTLNLGKRWIYTPQGFGPCFSMYLVEDIQE